MIVPMRKTALVCLRSEREDTLERLRELGVMHVEAGEKIADSQDRAELAQETDRLERALGFLSVRRQDRSGKEELSNLDRECLTGRVFDAIDENTRRRKDLDLLHRDRERLLPWGDFSPELVETLRKNGIFVYLCIGSRDDMALLPEGVAVKVVRESKGHCHFAVIAQRELDGSKLPLASLPQEMRLSEVDTAIRDTEKKLAENERTLDRLAACSEQLRMHADEIRNQLDFLTVRDTAGEVGELCYLQGYVPDESIEELKRTATRCGWALRHVEAERDDVRVPTLLRIPKACRIIEPMMNFLGIAPGYGEVDVSVSFLFFLTIFFGMILGDAGYGLVFVFAAIALKLKFASVSTLKRPLSLLLVFGTSTVIWGALGGTWFGISADVLPKWMQGIPFFGDPALKDKNIQYFCFILAIMHLTTGRLWRAVLLRNSIRQFLGEVGWAVILWGNFFVTLRLLVFPGPIESFVHYLYIIGLVLVVFCGVNWRDIGEAFNFPFGLIGTFVDILSYIRLYAVGMSGFYIANSFNHMGVNLMGASDSKVLFPLLIVGGVGVILFGHLLNIALCMMGVLVHGVRLNTLEFSNHIGLRWVGLQYKPFAKSSNSNPDTKEN